MHWIKRLIVTGFLSIVLVASPMQTLATVQSAAPSAKISFTFDDGYNSAATQAAPILAKYGFSATDYVITGCVGMTTVPNTCRADNRATYMSWAQVQQLSTTYHWEIGSHTVTHPYLASSSASDGQPNVLTPAQVDYELSQSKADLAVHGINAVDFATPYGDYSPPVLAGIAKHYASQRGYADIGYNSWPYSDYYLHVQQVKRATTVAAVENYINTAAASNSWLILVFHNIKSNPTSDGYTPANLDKIAAYVKSLGLPVTNIQDSYVKSDTNLLPNPSFNSGLGAGWASDSAASFVADGSGNGSYPDPLNSIKFASASSETYLFSPLISVNSATNYAFKTYLNVVSNSGTGIGIYIDEYNGFGQWISGQNKYAERGVFAEEANFGYTPSSARVSYIRYQVWLGAGAGTIGYLDNAQMFSLTNPPPPPPPPTSLLPNSTFDDGLADGWRTDNAADITADAGSNGSPANPVNSIKLVSDTRNVHLFSPAIQVTNKTYNLSLFLKISQISSGEIGFYIDEYNASGQWISGQYKTGVSGAGSGDVGFSYQPTSSSVASASLQVIVVANSNAIAYFDNAIWQ